jgi:hypothetical protein
MISATGKSRSSRLEMRGPAQGKRSPTATRISVGCSDPAAEFEGTATSRAGPAVSPLRHRGKPPFTVSHERALAIRCLSAVPATPCGVQGPADDLARPGERLMVRAPAETLSLSQGRGCLIPIRQPGANSEAQPRRGVAAPPRMPSTFVQSRRPVAPIQVAT